jgi:peptidoglycan/LPS O-acetylase OafA/YrhL
MKYRKEIDGLRALALVPVVFSHAGFKWFKGTYVMIDLFFVISGYLITSLIAKEKSSGTFSAMVFYERRARRLLPALFVMMLVSIPLAWFLLAPNHLLMFCKSLIAVPLFSSNFLFWSESGYFAPDTGMKPFLQTWSLSVEEQFYLLFPLIFAWFWPKGKKKLISFLVFISLLSLVCMQWGLTNNRDANWYLLPGRIWEFTLGAILALLPESKLEKNRASHLSEFLSFVGLSILLVSVFSFSEYQPFPSFYTLFPLFGTALIIRFANSRNIVGRLLGAKILVGIGLISYGVFVWHQPLFAFARHYFLSPIKPEIYGGLILLSFILAYLSWRFVEAPFRNRNFLSRKSFLTICALFSFAFIVMGSLGVINRGFPNRNERLVSIHKAQQSIKKNYFFDGVWTPQFNADNNLKTFIEKWQENIGKPSQLPTLSIAIFGNSLGTNIYSGLQRNGYQPIGLFGGGCPLNPRRMPPSCLQLANLFYDYVKQNKSVRHIALVMGSRFANDFSVENYKEILNFWKPLNRQIIVFSQTPIFPFLWEKLQRQKKPEPEFQFSDLSLRNELKTFFRTQGVYLIDSKEIFCKITGTCDYKINHDDTVNENDFLFLDNYHLSASGQKEFIKILLETDPLFKKILLEAQHP